jgi:hypothetical protein
MSDFGRHFYICLNHIGRVVVSTTGALASSGFVPCSGPSKNYMNLVYAASHISAQH